MIPIPKLPLGGWIEQVEDGLTLYFGPVFDLIHTVIGGMVGGLEAFLTLLPAFTVILLVTALAYWIGKWRLALFALIGLLLIDNLGLWGPSMQSLALVLTASVLAVLAGVPVGILSAQSAAVRNAVTPVLDFMQTMPAFVYLLPAVSFFSLGVVPGVIASIIFAIPPTIRLTILGIRQVSWELVEAADAFGSTPGQKLIKVQLPIALPTIMAGINQTIMLSLSMVVISSMIGAQGVGAYVYRAVSQAKTGAGFEAGIAIVVIAILLDRLTQKAFQAKRREVTVPGKQKQRKLITVSIAALGLLMSVVLPSVNPDSVSGGGAETASGESAGTVKLAYVAWDSEIASSYVIKEVLESKLDKSVDMLQVDAGPMFAGVADGSADAMVAAWLPSTHASYLEKYGKRMEDLGANLNGTKIGLTVPAYMNIDSIEDLKDPAVAASLDRRLIGIEPGAGIMTSTEKALADYGLGEYTLVESSSAAMAQELQKAYDSKQPIVVTGWTPHWMFAKMELKYLADPKGVYGGDEQIHTMVRQGLKDDQPDVYRLLDRFQWTPEDMAEVMVAVHEGQSPENAAKAWVEAHPDKVNQWMEGIGQVP